MRSTPKRQHYVPQFLLKKFLDPRLVSKGKKMLWVYEANREPRRVNPRETAFEREFYSFQLGDEKSHYVDDAFTKIEGVAAPIIDKLANNIFKLDLEEKAVLAGFIALSFTRTPWFREGINEDVESIVKKIDQIKSAQPGFLGGMLPTPEITENVEEKARQNREIVESNQRLKQIKKALSIRTSLQIMSSLIYDIGSMSNTYYVTEDEHRFLTTDITVSLYDPNAPLVAGFRSSPTTQFNFPISKNVCLIGNRLGIEKVISVKPPTVRKMNKYAMGLARRFVFASEQSNKLRDLFTNLWNERENPRREKDA